ncbi:MAG: terminase large subunit [Methylobacterium mesophilicum]|nr:terminase large subunit [Methylobacterium mesophilicum]
MTKSAFPSWIYDGSDIPDPLGYGEEAVQFLRKLKHPAGSAPGRSFQLYAPFERMTRGIYGPRNPDGSRVVRTVFLMVGRGNRKTSYASAWSLLHLLGPEKRAEGQVIFAACDREQAGIGFREAANIVRMDKRLVRATKINEGVNAAKQIRNLLNGSTLRAVSSDGKSLHGTTPTFVLADELHAWKGRDLWEAIDSGLAKVSDTLMIIATTAGRGQENIGFEKYQYALKVARGEIIDPTFLPLLFMAEPGDDLASEETWLKANPGLPFGFPNLDALRIKAKQAEHSPSDRHQFEQLHLNVWKSASRDPLFDMETYDASRFPFELEELEELPCYLGVDLSKNGDLTAIVGAWKHDDGRVTVFPWFFVPGEGLEERGKRDRVPYEAWKAGDLIKTSEGPIIEPEDVEAFIRELCARFDVREVSFDPHLAATVMQRLHADGIPVVEFRQAPLTMAPAIADLERTVNGRKLRHNGHPVLRHHFDSVVASRGDTGLVRMHKASRFDRIDGAVAAAMSVSRAVSADQSRSIYDFDPDEWEEAA